MIEFHDVFALLINIEINKIERQNRVISVRKMMNETRL